MKSLKLNQIEKNILSKKEMNQAKGGRLCGCGCRWVDQGGSSMDVNGNANYSGGEDGLVSPELMG